jgi:hypothetical protein
MQLTAIPAAKHHMTAIDSWHMPDGVGIWATPKLRQPHLEMHERDGPLRVVLLADYEALARSFQEAVSLLKAVQDTGVHRKKDLSVAIQKMLSVAA